VQPCVVCGWQPAHQRGCNACRLFLMRHGRDKDVAEVMKGWERRDRTRRSI
jgi:hypothetical protein